MFEAFFVVLKGKGIAVTPGEWLSLQEALDKGLCGCSLSDFYMLSRMLLVKRETDYDRFDLAFGEFFQGIEKGTALSSRLLEWLDKPEMNELLQEKRSEGAFSLERREESAEETEALLEKRLKEQTSEHNGGSYWVGTMGRSSFRCV